MVHIVTRRTDRRRSPRFLLTLNGKVVGFALVGASRYTTFKLHEVNDAYQEGAFVELTGHERHEAEQAARAYQLPLADWREHCFCSGTMDGPCEPDDHCPCPCHLLDGMSR